jgi:hypothetical protein
MNSRVLRIRAWALLVALSGTLPGIAAVAAVAADDGAESRTERIRVTAERPLYAFSLELAKRHPVAVTYEEAPAPASSTAGTAGSAGKRATPGTLVVEVRVLAATGKPEDLGAVLADAIAAQDSAGGDLRFRVLEDRGTFHIVPDGVRDAGGKWVKVVPVLDTPITLPAEERPVAGVLAAIRDALARDAGAKVVLAEVPVNWAIQTKVQLSGRTESARELLGEALASRPFTWQLLYDPKLEAYVLRIQPLAAATAP